MNAIDNSIADTLAGFKTPKVHRVFLRDMDAHLIDCIVEIAARVPRRRGRLSPSLAVGGAGLDGVVAGFGLPLMAPEAPRIASLFVPEAGRSPTRPSIGRDFNLHYIRFAGPGYAMNHDPARLEIRLVERARDRRLHAQCRERMGIFRLHRIAWLYRLVRKAVSRAHEVSHELRFQNFDLGEPLARRGADPS